jgi:predicted XRE-type DNA-binding protein
MAVYIIRAGDTEMVKIGWAVSSVEKRVADLQCAHYEALRILRVFDGAQRAERWLHDYFCAQRIRREWFRFVDEMLTIVLPANLLTIPPTTKPPLALRTMIRQADLTQAVVAANLGVAPSMISHISRGYGRLQPRLVPKLAALLGVPQKKITDAVQVG